MSELYEDGELTWFEAWQAPMGSMQDATLVGCEQSPIIHEALHPLVYATVGCIVGMLSVFAIATSFMHGVLAQVKSLNQLGEVEREDEPDLEVTKR